MVFNPTLMFERGWEQYVGTSDLPLGGPDAGPRALRL